MESGVGHDKHSVTDVEQACLSRCFRRNFNNKVQPNFITERCVHHFLQEKFIRFVFFVLTSEPCNVSLNVGVLMFTIIMDIMFHV